MNALLLAQLGGYSIVQIAVFCIVVAGIIGVVYVITRQVGVQIPPWIITIFWILLAVVVGVFAVRFLASMF